jgi:hypothetical protein
VGWSRTTGAREAQSGYSDPWPPTGLPTRKLLRVSSPTRDDVARALRARRRGSIVTSCENTWHKRSSDGNAENVARRNLSLARVALAPLWRRQPDQPRSAPCRTGSHPRRRAHDAYRSHGVRRGRFPDNRRLTGDCPGIDHTPAPEASLAIAKPPQAATRRESSRLPRCEKYGVRALVAVKTETTAKSPDDRRQYEERK